VRLGRGCPTGHTAWADLSAAAFGRVWLGGQLDAMGWGGGEGTSYEVP